MTDQTDLILSSEFSEVLRNSPAMAADYLAHVFETTRLLILDLQTKNANLQHQIDAINHPACATTPSANLIHLPSGRYINIAAIFTITLLAGEYTRDGEHEGNKLEVYGPDGRTMVRGTDVEALLNYLDRIAPHVLPSGLTAGECIADNDAEELRR
jgi:hypothetical protein